MYVIQLQHILLYLFIFSLYMDNLVKYLFMEGFRIPKMKCFGLINIFYFCPRNVACHHLHHSRGQRRTVDIKRVLKSNYSIEILWYLRPELHRRGNVETRGDSVVPISYQISVFLLTLMRNNKLPLSEGTWHRITV